MEACCAPSPVIVLSEVDPEPEGVDGGRPQALGPGGGEAGRRPGGAPGSGNDGGYEPPHGVPYDYGRTTYEPGQCPLGRALAAKPPRRTPSRAKLSPVPVVPSIPTTIRPMEEREFPHRLEQLDRIWAGQHFRVASGRLKDRAEKMVDPAIARRGFPRPHPDWHGSDEFCDLWNRRNGLEGEDPMPAPIDTSMASYYWATGRSLGNYYELYGRRKSKPRPWPTINDTFVDIVGPSELWPSHEPQPWVSPRYDRQWSNLWNPDPDLDAECALAHLPLDRPPLVVPCCTAERPRPPRLTCDLERLREEERYPDGEIPDARKPARQWEDHDQVVPRLGAWPAGMVGRDDIHQIVALTLAWLQRQPFGAWAPWEQFAAKAVRMALAEDQKERRRTRRWSQERLQVITRDESRSAVRRAKDGPPDSYFVAIDDDGEIRLLERDEAERLAAVWPHLDPSLTRMASALFRLPAAFADGPRLATRALQSRHRCRRDAVAGWKRDCRAALAALIGKKIA